MNRLANSCRNDLSPIRFLLCFSSFLACFAPNWAHGDDSYVPDRVSFKRDVRPIFSDHCFACHGPDANRREADLRLDTQVGAMMAIQVGDAATSELMRRILSHDDEVRMPPAKFNKKLSPNQIEKIQLWIDQGAAWEDHWSFTQLIKPIIPQVPVLDGSQQPRNPIDAFIQSQLLKRGWKPAAQADRRTLLRRVTLDLTGLPPAVSDVEKFLEDASPMAYEEAVARILHSSAFGERMAWDWLDAARYADTNGYQGDRERTMWPWRDWVVKAFNENLPFDQFTIWQLAGDMLPDATVEQKLATGFCRNHMINGEGGRIPEENRIDYVMDMTETMGTVWLGLTLNCCRCHDHKFDPVKQQEYYQLFAFFDQTTVDGGGGDPQSAPTISIPSTEQQSELNKLELQLVAANLQIKIRSEQLAVDYATWESDLRQSIAFSTWKLPEILKASTGISEVDPLLEAVFAKTEADLSKADRALLTKRHQQSDDAFRSLEKNVKSIEERRKSVQASVPKVMVMAQRPKLRETFALQRGLYNHPGDKVSANVPASLPPLAADVPSDRLAMAKWLVSNEQPLTARVVVNRFWQQMFGVGLVKTVEDFGSQGEIPRYLDLLDWLAADFRDSGWDTKRLLNMIVTSHAYRQSSSFLDSEIATNDPENRWIARGPRYRMPSWMLRDQALAASGLLVPKLGGEAVNGYQPEGVWEEASFGNKKYKQGVGDAIFRRSLYIYWRRIIGPTMFFDNASRQVCTVKSVRTNTPLHALFTLNDVTFVEAARALATRALQYNDVDDSARIDYVYQRVLCRHALDEEKKVLTAALMRSRKQFTQSPAQAIELLSLGESKIAQGLNRDELATWTALCLAVFNLDETLTKE